MPDVTLYTTSWCGECHIAKSYLDERGIRYREIDIEEWDDPRGHLEEITGNRTVPQIVVDGRVLGGFETFLRMKSTGDLERMLTE